jgi:hypothetical protein
MSVAYLSPAGRAANELRSYQAQYVVEHALDPAWYLAFEPRLGKTRAEAYAIARRVRERDVRRILVVGPKNPLTLTWEEELRAVGFDRPSNGGGPLGYLVPLQDGTTEWRAGILRDLIAGAAGDRPTIVLMNFDVLERRITKTKRLSDLLTQWGVEDIVCDEGHFIKSAGATRSRSLRRLGRGTRFRRVLSGTPDPNGLQDLYGQFVFLAPEIFGTNKSKFLYRYFVMNPFVFNRIEGRREENVPELLRKFLSVTSRVRAVDYFGEIPENEITRTIPWPPDARKLYDALAQESVLTERDDDITVDGTHKLTKLLRFRQLCAGYLKDELSDDIRPIHGAKIDTLVADLAEPLACGQRVVVSYCFTPDGARAFAEIARVYGPKSVALVNGASIDPAETLRLFDVQNDGETPVRVLVVQEQVGGVGISLARAQHLIFTSWSLDSAIHEQMRKRIWDPSRPATYTYLQMRDSVDQFARACVRDKRNASIMLRELGLAATLRGTV